MGGKEEKTEASSEKSASVNERKKQMDHFVWSGDEWNGASRGEVNKKIKKHKTHSHCAVII